MNERTEKIILPPGIGDLHWFLVKLEAYKKLVGASKIHVYIADEGKQRGHQILEICGLVDSWEYVPIPYTQLKYGTADIDATIMDPNSWLEAGNRLEDWLPTCETM